MACAAKMIGALLVGNDEKKVRTIRHVLFPSCNLQNPLYRSRIGSDTGTLSTCDLDLPPTRYLQLFVHLAVFISEVAPLFGQLGD